MADRVLELSFSYQVVDFGASPTVDGWSAPVTVDLTDAKPWAEIVAAATHGAAVGQDILIPSGDTDIRLPVLPEWQATVGIGDVHFSYDAENSLPTAIDVVVSTPSEYAGTYEVDTSAIASGPVNEVVPELVTALEPGDLAARNGLWFYDPVANSGVEITGRWVRASVVGDYATRVPLVAASGLQFTSRDSYSQPFHADAANPPTWEERVESAEGNSAYVAATAPSTVVTNPFVEIIARSSALWAYNDLAHLGACITTKVATDPKISAYNERAGLVLDHSGNDLHAVAITSSPLQFPHIVLEDGAIWDSYIDGDPTRNIALDLDGATEFTMCVAVRLKNRLAASTEPQAIMCARATVASELQTGIWFNHDANRFHYRVRIGSTSTLVATATPAAAPSTETPLIAVVTLRKTTTGVQAWLNDTALAMDAEPTGAVSAALANNVHLKTSGNSNLLADGAIGPWFVSRFALTDQEAADLRAYYMSIVGVSA